MGYSVESCRIVTCLVSNGFSRQEARNYLKLARLEVREERTTRLVRSGGIKRVRIEDGVEA